MSNTLSLVVTFKVAGNTTLEPSTILLLRKKLLRRLGKKVLF